MLTIIPRCRLQVANVPSVFVVKRLNVVMEMEDTDMKNATQVGDWVLKNTFPLVGEFSVHTYYRYMRRGLDMALLFYDQEEAENDPNAHGLVLSALEVVAKEYSNQFSFVSVGRGAQEENGALILRRVGLTNFRMPALAIRSTDRIHVFAMNQGEPLDAEHINRFMSLYIGRYHEYLNSHVSVTLNKQHITSCFLSMQ